MSAKKIGRAHHRNGGPYNHNLSEIATKSGFKFRDIENRKLDWKMLGCVDVNKVIDNQDYDFLQKIIPKIIEAPMQSILNTAILDPAVSSLFRLAQLSLQYLSFCQQFMDHTLYDLRTAFNQLQKKNMTLKHNYKCLEEEHYKAQERIQSLLKLLANQSEPPPNTERIEVSAPKTSVLFPCEQCTKNFLTKESLQSHQHRKHNEKLANNNTSETNDHGEVNGNFGNIYNDTMNVVDYAAESTNVGPQGELQTEIKLLKEQMNTAEREILQINNNNNNDDNASNANCTVCNKKPKIDLTNVAVQCDEGKISMDTDKDADMNREEVSDELNYHKQEDDKCQTEKDNEKLLASTDHASSIQCKTPTQYDQAIIELKNEIAELKNALQAKTAQAQLPFIASMHSGINCDDTRLDQTHNKINVIEQKFTAFESMYVRSQHEFIETFRNLDERQKSYMLDMQDTIKEIVEQSLKKYETNAHVDDSADHDIDAESVVQLILETGVEDAVYNEIEHPEEKVLRNEVERPAPNTIQSNSSSTEYSDSNESSPRMNNVKKTVCQAEVYENHKNDNAENTFNLTKKWTKKTAVAQRRANKTAAINEFQQRLNQFGVDAGSTGLTTPRSIEVIRDLADEREEIKKANRSFSATRNKLKNEIDRIAKAKLPSDCSLTSLSSSSQHSDERLSPENSSNMSQPSKLQRPKTANIHTKRKSNNGKQLLKKLIENDIDESDIMDKMKLAQKAIDAHRDCIQELLQTTAHAPKAVATSTSNVPRIQYQPTISEKNVIENNHNKIQMVENIDAANSNRYNKMPNVTTRRVVFVNLDEDS